MSDRNIPSICLVLDASVARAAGPPESKHPTGSLCREFLRAIRGVGHRIAWNTLIGAELDRHQSNFFRTWFTSMVSIGKVRRIPDDKIEGFRDAIQNAAADQSVVNLMLKDAHLIEAAFESDKRVASLDETVRQHFGRLCSTFEPLLTVIWVNPVIAEEAGIDWLRQGAPDEAFRHFRPSRH